MTSLKTAVKETMNCPDKECFSSFETSNVFLSSSFNLLKSNMKLFCCSFLIKFKEFQKENEFLRTFQGQFQFFKEYTRRV